MEWWQKAVVVPVRRAWIVITARLRRKKDDGRGVLVKLHDDIQTCAYEDVQVMWEILQRSETEKLAREPPPKGARALVYLGRAAQGRPGARLSRPRRLVAAPPQHGPAAAVLSERMDLPAGGAAAASIALSSSDHGESHAAVQLL